MVSPAGCHICIIVHSLLMHLRTSSKQGSHWPEFSETFRFYKANSWQQEGLGSKNNTMCNHSCVFTKLSIQFPRLEAYILKLSHTEDIFL